MKQVKTHTYILNNKYKRGSGNNIIQSPLIVWHGDTKSCQKFLFSMVVCFVVNMPKLLFGFSHSLSRTSSEFPMHEAKRRLRVGLRRVSCDFVCGNTQWVSSTAYIDSFLMHITIIKLTFKKPSKQARLWQFYCVLCVFVSIKIKYLIPQVRFICEQIGMGFTQKR